MRLTSKLLGYLNRVFDKGGNPFLALRLQYAGTGMQWTVFDGFLTTTVQGGPGTALSVDLSQYTIGTLTGWLSLQPGYSVPYVTNEAAAASALRLIEGSGDQNVSNGDHILAYDSILLAYMDAQAIELATAQEAIEAMPAQLSTTTAGGSWLDYLGSYYAVARFAGESDTLYGNRIIATVLRPLGNNVAIEAALSAYTGQPVKITDVVQFNAPEPNFSGMVSFNGAYSFNPVVQPVYGLFDCLVGYDLLGGDVPTAFVALIRSLVEGLRDAGTHLRAVSLAGSVLQDVAPWPSDTADTLVVTQLRHFDGSWAFDGSIIFDGDQQQAGTIEGDLAVSPIGGGGGSGGSSGGVGNQVAFLIGGVPAGLYVLSGGVPIEVLLAGGGSFVSDSGDDLLLALGII